MNKDIKELRESTGMTQKAFAENYGIPLSTLRKWEQYEATPPAYMVSLLARSLPSGSASLEEIHDASGNAYYYDEKKKAVLDKRGNCIYINEDLKGVKRQNLGLYLHDLFEGYYALQKKFDRDCKFDKQEDILWS